MDTVLINGKWIPYPEIPGETLLVRHEGRIYKIPVELKYKEDVLDFINKTYRPSFFDRVLGNEYGESYHYEGRVAFPYKYCLSLGLFLIFMGIGHFFLSKKL